MSSFLLTPLCPGDGVREGRPLPRPLPRPLGVAEAPGGPCGLTMGPGDIMCAAMWLPRGCHVVVHNIIVGSLWMEQQGTMEIINRKSAIDQDQVSSYNHLDH